MSYNNSQMQQIIKSQDKMTVRKDRKKMKQKYPVK